MRWEVWFSLLLPPLLVALRLLGCKPSRRLTSSPALFGALCAAAVIAQPWVRLTFGTGPLWNQVQLYLPVFGVGVAIAAYEPRLRAAAARIAGVRGWLALVAVVLVLSARAPLGALDAVDSLDHRWALCLQNASVLLGMSGAAGAGPELERGGHRARPAARHVVGHALLQPLPRAPADRARRRHGRSPRRLPRSGTR